MLLEQRDEAQIAESFRFGCVRGSPSHTAVTRTTPEEAHEHLLSDVSSYEHV